MLYDLIQERRGVSPLLSVSVSIPARASCAVVRLRQRAPSVGQINAGVGVSVTCVTPIRDTRIVWDISDVDTYVAVLDAAWRLGAWDVQRIDSGPLLPEDIAAGLAVTASFVGAPHAIAGVEHDAGAGDPDCAAAAREHGYTSWLFKPTAGNDEALWFRERLRHDKSLDADGGRSAVRHVQRRQRRTRIQPGALRRVIYRLGDPR